MNKRIHAVISGRVQQVGFRSFVEDEADNLGLTGWTRNLYSGEVEVVAEGDELKLQAFSRRISQGPSLSHIIHFNLEWLPATGEFPHFNVRSTFISE
jgi:acylphosphatase